MGTRDAAPPRLRAAANAQQAHPDLAAHPQRVPAETHHERLIAGTRAVIEAPTALQALAANKRLLEVVIDARTDAVADARLENQTWTEIGEALGVTKQAAQKKYGVTPEPAASTPAEPSSSPTSHFEYRDLKGVVRGHLEKVPGPAPRPFVRRRWLVRRKARRARADPGR